MWQVFLYIAILVSFLMVQRVNFCLLFTTIFTYYLAYLIYWGDIIMSVDTLTPFFLYVVCGLAIVVLFVAASFSDQARSKRWYR